ncbi:MAG: class I tRNA ligase family protein, partial [Bacteroidales bacterium]|nr:class I tRNA ligase family protein [Bacteroidales bacterium]
QSKPWDTKGIDGVNRFLKKFWRMFTNAEGDFYVSDQKATPAELKALHKLIYKVGNDVEQFSFNTSISAFMIALNELQDLKCNKREILEQFVILLSPFAPHITEELWSLLGHTTSVSTASFPEYVEAYTVENTFEYPVSFNGKMRFKIELSKSLAPAEIEKIIRENENTAKYVGDNGIKKVIVVPNKIINVVC